MKKYYHTWDELNKNVSDICQQISVSDWKPDVVIGPGRGS